MSAAFSHLASRIDWPIFMVVLLIGLIGVGNQYSAGDMDSAYMLRHGVRMMIALAAMLLIACIPLERLSQYTPYAYVIATTLLVLVLLIGLIGQGAQRWISLGGIRFQPSELMKVVLPLMVAWILTRKPIFGRRVSFLFCFLIIVPPVLLVYQQPDLGTALLIAAAGIIAIFLGGVGWRWVIGGGVLAVAAIPLMWPLLHDYQRRRLLMLFDPWQDPLGAGYHSIQSAIGIGSGGLVGKGWLNGTQSQLEFIPERQTDFVFTVFAEEFGLLGSLFIFVLILYLTYRCLLIAYETESEFARIAAAVVGVMLFLQVFVNIGMVTGILPVVGVPFPLLSYGGTSMISVLCGIGIVMGARHAKV